MAPSRTRQDQPSIWSRLVTIARYAWAGPCSLAGLFLMVLVLFRGGTVRVRSGVVEAALPKTARKPWFPFSAITLGHVVLGRSENELDELFAHELEHVRQYERWGVIFFLAYPLSSLLQVFRRRSPYWFNHFEVQARERVDRAAHGWAEERSDAEVG